MTFEEFIKENETSLKIVIPPERYHIYERNYRFYMDSLEDQKYFEPLESSWYFYEETLIRQKILDVGVIKENQFLIVTNPSFTPSNLLIIEAQKEQFSLVFTEKIYNYCLKQIEAQSTNDSEINLFKTEIPKTLGEKVVSVFDKIFSEARPKQGKSFVIDGTVYSISKLVDGKPKTIFKHSPDETSKSGQVIEILKEIINNREDLNQSVLANIETKIDRWFEM